jgi:hypothetical protein
MKITNVDRPISFTMHLSQEEALNLLEITRAVANAIEFSKVSRCGWRGPVDAKISIEDLESAQEGLKLLYEMVKSLKDVR